MPLSALSAISFASDRQQESFEERAAFAKVRRAENDYGRRLRQVAKHIEDLVRAFASPGVEMDLAHLEQLLHRYSALIEPWARAVATRFVAEVARRDEQAWFRLSKKMSRELAREIQTAPTGFAMRQYLEEQVQLITSLPTQAAERVHEIAIGNLYAGERYGSLIEHIMETGRVTRNRATMIARTETARVSSSLTMARAQHVGSEGYIWRTVRDGRVRKSHREMEGKFVRWDDPPVVDPGVPPYHAGMVWNCRCFADVQIPDRFQASRMPA
jgi:SPP1 gp7 family putative phage head morphogenesis protein